MMLVAYSDSEGSDTEPVTKSSKPNTIKPLTNFTVDHSNPGKIKVNLPQTNEVVIETIHEDEPAPKRARTGNGAFTEFNSMLPAPKRNGLPTTQNEGSRVPIKKVLNLKTAAEASFSRESDAELRSLFADQVKETQNSKTRNSVTRATLPKPSFAKPPTPAVAGTKPTFKPLSVARNQKKKKPVINQANMNNGPALSAISSSSQPTQEKSTEPVVKKKISLFSAGAEPENDYPRERFGSPRGEDEEQGDDLYSKTTQQHTYETDSMAKEYQSDQPQSLDTIASDLNLTAAQKRQLFGRSGQSGLAAVNVVNFNTDAEYAANQAMNAAGETVQHNPVRAIAPGKHSLRQLVNAASGQKEALEDSFAEGRRNKKEAGNKYGW